MHQIVTAPLIAAKLSKVIKLAHELSISALNAKIITARSGEQGRALRPLTDHITEHTNEMLDIVKEITHHSIEFSFASIHVQRLEKSLELFQQGYAYYGKENAVIEDKIHTISKQLQEHQRALRDMERKLVRILEQLNMITKTFQFISINCDIESSQVPSIQKEFSVVSNVLKDAGGFIGETLDECFGLLKNAKGN